MKYAIKYNLIFWAVLAIIAGCGEGNFSRTYSLEQIAEGQGQALDMGNASEVGNFAKNIIDDVLSSQLATYNKVVNEPTTESSNNHIKTIFSDLKIDGENIASNGELNVTSATRTNFSTECEVSSSYDSYLVDSNLTLLGDSSWEFFGNQSTLDPNEVSFDIKYSSQGAFSVSGENGAAVGYEIEANFDGSNIATFFEDTKNYDFTEVKGSIEVMSGGIARACVIGGNVGSLVFTCR